MITNTKKSNNMLHLGIAEKGKVYSLEGNYKEALRYYGEALKMMQKENGNELFFQHYSQCVMEALELSGAYDEVITFCERYINFLNEKEEQTPIINKHYATIYEKLAIQYLLKEEASESLSLLKTAQEKVGKGKQPITDELLRWTQKGYRISKKQIEAIQKKYNYFIVRKELINNSIAVELPPQLLPI